MPACHRIVDDDAELVWVPRPMARVRARSKPVARGRWTLSVASRGLNVGNWAFSAFSEYLPPEVLDCGKPQQDRVWQRRKTELSRDLRRQPDAGRSGVVVEARRARATRPVTAM